MNDIVIEFKQVYKYYPLYHHMTGGIKTFLFNLPKAISAMKKTRFTALEDISFNIRRGETFGLIGRNGAGKSTTLALIAGVIKPNQGTISVKERVLPLLELGMGFQPELTGRENIILNGVLLGMTRRFILSKIDQIIEFAELGQFINQPLRTYSTGMVLRLGFSVIVHLEPKILLIDEILAVGDLGFQKKCLDKIQEFKQKGVTIVFVSHSMADIQRICDRVALLDNHKLVKIGNPQEVIWTYENLLKEKEII